MKSALDNSCIVEFVIKFSVSEYYLVTFSYLSICFYFSPQLMMPYCDSLLAKVRHWICTCLRWQIHTHIYIVYTDILLSPQEQWCKTRYRPPNSTYTYYIVSSQVLYNLTMAQ